MLPSQICREEDPIYFCSFKTRCNKRLLVFSIVLFINSIVYSQENILKIQLPKSKTPEEIQVISTEDKFLLAYKAGYVTPRSQPYNFYWVDKQGTVSEADYPELRGKLIAGITRDSVHSYFYYLDGDNRSITVNAIKESRLTGEKKVCDPTVIEGKLLGVTSHENRLIVYSFEKKAYQLRVTEKVNDAPASERLFNLSIDFSKFSNSDIAFVPEGAVIGASQASARVKIFIRSPNILIVSDDPFNQYAPSPQNIYKTVLININTRTGELSNRMVPEMSKGSFRSFPLSKYLFRVVAWAGDFTLQMFDIEKGELVNSKRILYDKKYKDKFVFLREGRANTISKAETLAHMMDISRMSVPFVVAQEEPLDDQGFIVTWGSYYNGKGTFPATGGVQGLIIMAVGTTIKQMSEGPGVSRYFYVRGSASEEFQIINDDSIDILRGRIDSFEMVHLSQDVHREGYYHAAGSIIAAYHDQRDSTLWLVTF